MKQIATWLFDKQAERFKKRCKRLGTNPYQHTRHLILADLGDIQDHVIRTTIIYGFTLYSLVAAVVVMVL